MKGDFSRLTFDKSKHYSAVRMQQGRVQLDADWNEQIDIINNRNQTQLIDLIGSEGGPINNAGYAILVDNNNASKLQIGSGNYYVNGLLCRNENAIYYNLQPDYPAQLPTPPSTGVFYYLAYLDVWQRSVLSAEDPAISETALGGADTCTRTQTVAQVKLLLVTATATSKPSDTFTEWDDLINNNITSVGALAASVSDDHNLQNQLYRIEIHTAGSNGTAQFKWSRDNAPQLEIINIQGNVITIKNLNMDVSTNIAIDQYIGLNSKPRELTGESEYLLRVTNVENDQVTVDLNGYSASDIADCTYVRLWNSVGPLLVNDESISIENGLEVEFSVSGNYRVGDYWLIPARSLSNGIEWPTTEISGQLQPQSLQPFGIQNHYARLALLQQDSSNNWVLLGDARKFFAAANDFLGKHAWPISLGSMYPALTNGATLVQVESATNKNNYRGWSFSQSGNNYLHFRIPMPKSWNAGTVTFVIYWTTTGTSGNVVWSIQGVARGNGDPKDQAFGTAVTLTSAANASAQAEIITSESAVMTLAGSPQSTDEIEIRINRNGGAGSDNLAAAAVITGIVMFINIDAGNDA